MVGYSYFNYDQMTIFEVEVHSAQLELLKDAADEYDWQKIESEVEPLFKKFMNLMRILANVTGTYGV